MSAFFGLIRCLTGRGRGKVPPADAGVPIFAHRAYRRISVSGRDAFLKFCIVILPLEAALFFFFPEITRIMNEAAKIALASYVPSEHMIIFTTSFLHGTIYLLDLPGKYPSPLLSFMFFCGSLLSVYLATKIKYYRPVGLWIIFLSGITILSSVVFILLPHTFPYTVLKFSELYVTTEVGMWLFVPLVMGMSLLPVPAGILSKGAVIILSVLYSVVFGVMRYIVFLFVISEWSYIFMPVLYFAFGPLLDFVYVVGIYSLYVSKVSERIAQDYRVWKWVF